MELCVPTLGKGGLDDFVSEHFGGAGNTLELVAGAGAEIMPCSGLGPQAINAFEQFGIEVYVGASGTVQDAIIAFQAGKLAEASDANACKMHLH